MENEDLNPIDLLSFMTDELETQFRNGKNAAEKTKFIQDFLERWEADSALSNIRNMEIEFENDLDWFNVKEPLTIKMLHGKIVVLDFFTYCCINCMHVLPELNDLEKMYTQERGLNVIGVHSPKFANEKDSANLLAAAQKYNIEHPVVNDCQMRLWRKIGICCWPSLLVLSPQGSPLILLMGEGHREFLECFIGETLRFYSKRNMIKNFVIPLSLTTNQMPASKLRFPAKIARLKDENIFALADAGNHRIIIFNMDGKVIHKIGGNCKGFVDGDFVNVRFNSPQGIVWFNENELIVADTENHALRKVTLDKRAVETLAGTGSQGSDRVGGKVGTLQALASPWDVAVFRTRDMDMSFHLDEQNVPERDIILISMAGTHQIWGYFPEGIIWWKFRKFEPKICVSIVGNGMEENRNNSYPQNAAFAQPSGITIANNYLFIADSESSSIRKVSMLDGKVMAVVGGDRNPANLFAFGDIDGKQYNAKLQHPLAVSYNFSDDKIYVADTYNHKLKAIDISSNTIESLLLINDKGISAALSEPSGLCFDKSGKNIIVSDTNNHQLQIVNVNTMVTTVFHLDFSEIPITTPTEAESLRTYELLKLLPLQLYKNLKVKVFLEICDGLKLTEEAPQKWYIFANNSTFQSLSNNGEILESFFEFELNRLQEKSSPDEKLSLKISLSLCNENSCLMKYFVLTLCNDISFQKVKTNEECLKLQITKDHIKLV